MLHSLCETLECSVKVRLGGALVCCKGELKIYY